MMDRLDANLVREHVGGVETELVELVERQKQSEADGRHEDAERLQPEIDALHTKLATAADVIPPAVEPGEEVVPG